MEREIDVLKQQLEKQKSSEESNAQFAYISEKFEKMKEFYNKLRSEHIELIRNVRLFAFVCSAPHLLIFAFSCRKRKSTEGWWTLRRPLRR